MATYLSERISELSGRMRNNVTAKTASGPAPASNMPATDIAKAHSMFQLPKEEKLISVYQCSVRPSPARVPSSPRAAAHAAPSPPSPPHPSRPRPPPPPCRCAAS